MSLHPKLPSAETLEDCTAQLKAAAPEKFPLGDRPRAVGLARATMRADMRVCKRTPGPLPAQLTDEGGGSFHAVEIDQPDVVAAAIHRVVELLPQ